MTSLARRISGPGQSVQAARAQSRRHLLLNGITTNQLGVEQPLFPKTSVKTTGMISAANWPSFSCVVRP
jgi:hypothetical protein